MNYVTQNLEPAPRLAESLVRGLRQQGFARADGSELKSNSFYDAGAWQALADAWSRLTLDEFMADGGTYRYRRYGEFELDSAGALKQLPHAPYRQPAYINKLNGDVDRVFDPLEPEFVANPFLTGLLRFLAGVFDAAEGRQEAWNIRLHPYRIWARDGRRGNPTPEGLHRDGVDFIVTLMVERRHVNGGETTITDARGKLLKTTTLMHPLDLLVANDALTMHGVSPIEPTRSNLTCYRDVLVIAYTRPWS